MFYNKDNPQWQLNQEQYLSREEHDRIVEEYDELCKSMLSADVRDINAKFYGVKDTGTPEEQEAKRKKALIGIIFGGLIFVALIISLIMKQLLIFGYMACAVFLIAGISLIVSGKGEVVESTSKAYLNRITGAGIALGSAIILLLIIFRNRFAGAEFFVLLFVIVFGITGLALLMLTLLKVTSGKFVYTQEVNATCTGYVRYVDRDTGENHNRFTFICTSPLFSYSVGGVQYEAVWDEFAVKADSDIALGQTVPVKVDPKHPENIMSPVMLHPGATVFRIFMAVACIGVAAGLGIYVSAGAAKNMTVETEWNPMIEKINGETEVRLSQITDDMINIQYADKIGSGKNWYYETGVVATKDYTSDGQSITFTDKTFNGVLYPDGSAPEPGTVMLLFYTVDEEYVSTGVNYKRIFVSGDPDKFEYSGSHTAFVPG